MDGDTGAGLAVSRGEGDSGDRHRLSGTAGTRRVAESGVTGYSPPLGDVKSAGQNDVFGDVAHFAVCVLAQRP